MSKQKHIFKGSMAEGYVMDHTLGFYTKYMSRFTPIRCRIWDDKEEPGLFDKGPKGGGMRRVMNVNLETWAHAFILENVVHLAKFKRYSSLVVIRLHFVFEYDCFIHIGK